MLLGIARLAFALLLIVGMAGAVALCVYAVAWVALFITSFMPQIGKGHRHKRWDEMNTRNRLQNPENPS